MYSKKAERANLDIYQFMKISNWKKIILFYAKYIKYFSALKNGIFCDWLFSIYIIIYKHTMRHESSKYDYLGNYHDYGFVSHTQCYVSKNVLLSLCVEVENTLSIRRWRLTNSMQYYIENTCLQGGQQKIGLANITPRSGPPSMLVDWSVSMSLSAIYLPDLTSLLSEEIMDPSQQTQDVELLLVKRWSTVHDGGPTLNQHWFDVFVCWDRSMISSLTFRIQR